MQRLNEVPLKKLKYDGRIHLALGNSKHEKRWKNKTLSWSEFLQRLHTPTITQETATDYAKMPKSQRDQIKDVGGFVGGWLKEGKRKRGNAQQRSIVTLDADSTTNELWDAVQLLFDHAVAIYTTHSHTAKHPRYRLIIPLKRPVTAEEYEPIARKLAETFGMDNFDDTTYQPERLMFWPSHAIDGEYVVDSLDLPWVDPDEILADYQDWRDASFWPESSRGHTIRENQAKKAGDPLEKKGIVGAFCRTYDIVTAIETFLPEIYGATNHEDRWTYLEGSTSGGLVIYEGKWAYSHHGTDPVGDQLSNAFDLVRVHKFGELDEEAKPGTPPQKLKSYKAMNSFLQEDTAVVADLKRERLGEAIEEFDVFELDEEKPKETGWLTFDQNGLPNINTYLLAEEVLSEVPIFYNGSEFLRYEPTTGVWQEGVEDYLRSYMTNKKLIKESKIRYLSEAIASIKNLAFTEAAFYEMDVNKLLLRNGVYDIKEDTFKLGFSKKLYARSSHPIEYDAAATCPTFDGFIKAVAGEENADFIYEWFGYNFYREYVLQKMLFIHGQGGTGKSTLVNLLKELIGFDNYSAVTLKNLMNERFAPVSLYRKSANFDTDAKPEYLADGSLLKQLTGEDTIYADRKNKDPIYFYNYAKLTFAMNELPAMRDFSGGLRRRLLILRMDEKLTTEVKRQFPLKVMQAERAGIFNAAMTGLRRALKHGFTESASMQASVGKWVKGNDVLSLFIEDECQVGANLKTPVKDAYSDYVVYCKASGYKPMSRNNFVDRMKELGFEHKQAKIDNKNVKCWVGINTNGSDF